MRQDRSQPSRKKNLMATSLKRARSPHSLLLRMAADAERAQRLKMIKDERPDLTWPQVADAVGVSERSVAAWAKDGQMSYGNAKKLALFLGVGLDWLWRGPQPESPDLMSALTTPGDLAQRLDQIDERGQRIEGMLEQLLETAFQRELEDADHQADQRESGSGEGAGGSAASAKA